MKAVFVHDHRFSVAPSGAVYSPGKLPYTAWQRYLREFDELEVIGRSDPVREEDSARLNLSSGERVSFVFVSNLTAGLTSFGRRAEVMGLLRRQISKADAVIARNSLLGGMAASVAGSLGKPCAVEVVGCPWDSYWNYGSFAGKVYAPFAWWTTRRWLRSADYAIYVTREFLQRRYPCRGLCAYASNVEIQPVAETVLAEKIARWKTEGPASSSGGELRIGMIGSLSHRYKGLHVALNALHRLAKRGLRPHLHVLGDGKLEAWKQSARRLGIADHVHIEGPLPGGEPVMQWLDGLDAYIQPSLQEGLPRSLIEAMSRGLPALGSSCGGIPELLSPDCLHRPGDDRMLAGHLTGMLQNRTWRIQRADRNYREAQAYYQEKVAARRSAFWSQFAEAVRKQARVVQ